jgi:hypothetical protein
VYRQFWWQGRLVKMEAEIDIIAIYFHGEWAVHVTRLQVWRSSKGQIEHIGL